MLFFFRSVIGQESFIFKETDKPATSMEKELEETRLSLKYQRMSVNYGW